MSTGLTMRKNEAHRIDLSLATIPAICIGIYDDKEHVDVHRNDGEEPFGDNFEYRDGD